jgi:hypothetical protein
MTAVDWKTLFPFCFGAERQWSLRLVTEGDVERSDAEAFVRERFSECHRANVSHFMPELLVLHGPRGTPCAVAGLRTGGSGRLFLEKYLLQPVEAVISDLAGRAVDRSGIVEVGNLAAKSAGSTRLIIVAMAWLLAQRGTEWAVFTGTATLVNSFHRLGLDPLAFCAADPERLGAERHAWGDYYAQNPRVFAGDICFGRDELEKNGCLDRLCFPGSGERAPYAA